MVTSYTETRTCNCTNASLMGTTIAMQYNTGPVVNRVVGAAPELPPAGGASPGWDIDLSGNTIRIDFLPLGTNYGIGAHFTFSNIYPLLAGCPLAFISGISVITNKPAVPFDVADAASFTAHSVTVSIVPAGGIQDWCQGDYILVKLNFAC
ncbi:MAG: hypothetical protein JWQ38_1360 [Flavipsychrobacter sp.]|nr:hypothetical protein [Flavipsychrobacter sp.]